MYSYAKKPPDCKNTFNIDKGWMCFWLNKSKKKETRRAKNIFFAFPPRQVALRRFWTAYQGLNKKGREANETHSFKKSCQCGIGACDDPGDHTDFFANGLCGAQMPQL